MEVKVSTLHVEAPVRAVHCDKYGMPDAGWWTESLIVTTVP